MKMCFFGPSWQHVTNERDVVSVGCNVGAGVGVTVQKSILHMERIGHLSWDPGKALGIIFSDAVKFFQQMFSWGFWPELRLLSMPHL